MAVSTDNLPKLLEETAEKYKKFHNPTLVRLLKFGGYNALEVRADGVFVYDQTGKEYLDCAGGYGVFTLGHRHPEVIRAVHEQLELMPLSSKVFFNKPLADLTEAIAGIMPGNLQYSFICNSGAEAVEGALKIARLSTGKTGVVSAAGAFHGKTFGCLSASGRELYKAPFEPLLDGFVQVPFGDVVALEEAVTVDTAAIILEPIQGEGGIILPPDGYFREVRRICTEKGCLFIADEVQSGLARTGRMFAVEHWGVVPDIMVMAKALGGGVMPIGAFTGTPKVWECFGPNPLLHTSTFGGNPLACRAALATIEVLRRDNFSARAHLMGTLFKEKLQAVAQEFPDLIAEVRGLGLMIGVELTQEKFGGAIIYEMARGGVIAVYTLNMPRVIRFEPPVIVEEIHIDRACRVLSEALTKTRKMFSK